MRGVPDPQLAMLTTLSTEDLVPGDHPVRRIRAVVDAVLDELDSELTAMYAEVAPVVVEVEVAVPRPEPAFW